MSVLLYHWCFQLLRVTNLSVTVLVCCTLAMIEVRSLLVYVNRVMLAYLNGTVCEMESVAQHNNSMSKFYPHVYCTWQKFKWHNRLGARSWMRKAALNSQLGHTLGWQNGNVLLPWLSCLSEHLLCALEQADSNLTCSKVNWCLFSDTLLSYLLQCGASGTLFIMSSPNAIGGLFVRLY